MTYPVSDGPEGLVPALEDLCMKAAQAADNAYTLLILSDRKAGKDRVPISSLIAIGAVHHHLIRQKLRMRVGLILETGEAR